MKLQTCNRRDGKPVRNILCFLVFFLVLTQSTSAQVVNFTSSNLPILIINTNGNDIVDEPKVTAHMSIINNGNGDRNYLTDDPNEYDGAIGIELRGNSSQTWAKKPYGIETRYGTGENYNVSLFNMPKENDWVLHAPYVDKTLLRNTLIYKLASEIGLYAPRTQFCELMLNDEYMGVFVLIEKIKKDPGRVNISKPTLENITGGYILEMIMNKQLEAGETHFKLPHSEKEVLVKYPKVEDILPEQLQYISTYLNDFENALNSDSFADSIDGYAKFIDIPSFIDQMIMSEGFNQLDAFSHSVFLHKDKDSKLHLGPGWDYNRSMGNGNFYNSWRTDVWLLKEEYDSNPDGWHRINWPERLMEDPGFMKAYASRWYELRKTILNLDHIYSLIDANADLLEEARVRNFERWDVLGVGFNNKFVFDTYEEEIAYMKEWLSLKFSWLDEQFLQTENYALSASVNYSSQEGVNPAVGVSDGKVTTRWSAEFFPQWIELDLGEVKNINKTITIPFIERAYQYQVEGKETATEDYTVLVDRSENMTESVQFVDEFESVNARFVKLTVSGANIYEGDWCSILEFKVFGEESFVNTVNSVREKYDLLIKNYPNPFSAHTTIEYDLAETGFVSLKVYNSYGLEVAQLVHEIESAGNHKVIFNAEGLAPGFYIYKIDGKGFSESDKMLIIK